MTQPPNQPQGWWQPPPPGQGYPPHAPGRQPAPPPAQLGTTFGGNFQSQYGGLGAFGNAPQQKPKRSKKPWLAGGAVVVVLAGGGTAAWLLGAFQGEVLDQQSLQTNVAKVLRDSYGEQDVKNVQCPGDQEIKAGNTFDCTVEISGRRKAVSIRVLNDKPEYEVGAPK